MLFLGGREHQPFGTLEKMFWRASTQAGNSVRRCFTKVYELFNYNYNWEMYFELKSLFRCPIYSSTS